MQNYSTIIYFHFRCILIYFHTEMQPAFVNKFLKKSIKKTVVKEGVRYSTIIIHKTNYYDV